MDLGLEITAELGPLAEMTRAEYTRDLTPEDLPLLALPRPPDDQHYPAVKRIGDRHHHMARLFAQGAGVAEVAAIVRMTTARVAVIKADKSFRALVDFYQQDLTREARTTFERLAGLAADAADELAQRLEDSPEKLSNSQLLEIVKVAADRSGHGPTSTAVQLNINAGLADRMAEARRKAQEASFRTIEATPTEVPPDGQ